MNQYHATAPMKYLYNDDATLMSIMGTAAKSINNKYAPDWSTTTVNLYLTRQKISQCIDFVSWETEQRAKQDDELQMIQQYSPLQQQIHNPVGITVDDDAPWGNKMQQKPVHCVRLVMENINRIQAVKKIITNLITVKHG